MARLSRTHLNIAVFVAGAVVFAGLIYWVSAGSILEHLRAVGPWVLPVILGYGLAQMSFNLAWLLLIRSEGRRPGFWRLFQVYLAGDAVNYLVVSGNLAGEPVKAHLLREELPFVEGLSSVTINKLSETISMVAFQAVGVTIALFHHTMDPSMAWGSLAVFVVMSVAIGLFFWRQREGLFGPIFKFFAKIGLGRSKTFSRMEKGAETVDRQISDYYARGGKNFFPALLFNFFGWCGGAIEGYLLLRLMGFSVSWLDVWMIEALVVLANNLFFFVPGRMGGSDGGKVLVFVTMGLGKAAGMSFGLLKRARELFYVCLGRVFLLRMKPFARKKDVTDGPDRFSVDSGIR